VLQSFARRPKAPPPPRWTTPGWREPASAERFKALEFGGAAPDRSDALSIGGRFAGLELDEVGGGACHCTSFVDATCPSHGDVQTGAERFRGLELENPFFAPQALQYVAWANPAPCVCGRGYAGSCACSRRRR
jgi:hypothetical protein